MNPTTEKALLSSAFIAAALVATATTLFLPSFAQALIYSGTDVPELASFLTAHIYLIWLLPVAVLAIWLAWPKGSSRTGAVWVIGTIGLLVIALAIAQAIFPQYFKLAITI